MRTLLKNLFGLVETDIDAILADFHTKIVKLEAAAIAHEEIAKQKLEEKIAAEKAALEASAAVTRAKALAQKIKALV